MCPCCIISSVLYACENVIENTEASLVFLACFIYLMRIRICIYLMMVYLFTYMLINIKLMELW